MRSLFILVILASPATAWEFSPAPICTLTDTSDAGTLTVTYDASLPEFTITITLPEGQWSDAPGFAMAFAGKSVRTVEGHAEGTTLSAVQQAFVDHFAFQCGYCTSGFVNEATALMERLEKTPVARSALEATLQEALGEHICRCTGYVRYYEAMRDLILSRPELTVEG